MKRGLVLGYVLAVSLLVAGTAWGQGGTNSGTIAGEVDDSSGAKVSGAKVEIASPALIERVRDTNTGDDGLYKVVNLPPGIYTVTATQEGFGAIKRDNIEVTTGFTATVNFALTPGSVQQTVTVTTEAPVLDTQDSVVQKVLSSAIVESLPLGKSAADYASLIPGAVAAAANQDVGGLLGENNQGFRIHGGALVDASIMRDGMPYNSGYSSGGGNNMDSNNKAATQEIQMETGGYSAEDWNAGGHVNVIPRSGGNDFHGTVLGTYSAKPLLGNNLNSADKALGVPTPFTIRSLYEIAGGIGGPIKKDKLWFFADARQWENATNQIGVLAFYNINETATTTYPSNLFWGADISRPAYTFNLYRDIGLRLTWQPTKRNTFTENWINEHNCNCIYNLNTGIIAPEATTDHLYTPNWREQGTWSFPVNNKLLLWAGFTGVVGNEDYEDTGGAAINPGNAHHIVPVTNPTSSTWSYGDLANNEGIAGTYGKADFLVFNENFTASYITGPHAFKFGYTEINDKESRATQFPNLGFQFLPGNVPGVANAANPYVNGYPNGVSLQMQCRPVAVAGTGGGAVAPTVYGTTSGSGPSSSVGIANSMNPTFNFSSNQTYGEPTSNFEIPAFSNGVWTTTQIPAMSFSATPNTAAASAGSISAGTINSLGCPTVKLGPVGNQTTFLQSQMPYQVTQLRAPYTWIGEIEARGIFGQDQWRIKRLTVNMGLRLDWFTAGSQKQTTQANPQFGLPAITTPAVKYGGIADWKDLNPRMGVAYDVFGNGKTAVKASLSRGVLTEGLSGIASLGNPVQTLVTSTSRPFTDLGGTLNPTADGGSFLTAQGSGGAGCAPLTGVGCVLGLASNPNFYSAGGVSSTANVSYANNVISGWQNRQYNWQFSASVQQEVTRGVAVSFGYYRTWYGNLSVAKNGLPAYNSAPGNYNQYCVTPPAVPAATYFSVGALGNSLACNFYDPTLANKALANSDTIQQSCIYGCEHDVYTGIDALVNARFHGLNVQGGLSAGHEVTNYCIQVNSPQDLFYTSNPTPVAGVNIVEFANNNFGTANDAAPCLINPPWSQNLQFKVAVVYTLPWQQIKLSANEQNLPSIPLLASYSYGNTCNCLSTPAGSAFPGTLSGYNTTTPKLEVVSPQTVFPYGRNNQLDFRVSKVFTIHERFKIEPTVSFFNIMNAAPILATNVTYNTTAPGSTGAFRNISNILPARLIEFGGHFDF